MEYFLNRTLKRKIYAGIIISVVIIIIIIVSLTPIYIGNKRNKCLNLIINTPLNFIFYLII